MGKGAPICSKGFVLAATTLARTALFVGDVLTVCRIERKWADAWVGVYVKCDPFIYPIGGHQIDVWICLIPCFPLHIRVSDGQWLQRVEREHHQQRREKAKRDDRHGDPPGTYHFHGI